VRRRGYSGPVLAFDATRAAGDSNSFAESIVATAGYVTVALASDCNPGTCYSSSMPFMIALAVRELGMTPAEALWSATAGSARSLRRDDIGHLGVGARADIAVIEGPTYLHLAYRPGMQIAHRLSSNATSLIRRPTTG